MDLTDAMRTAGSTRRHRTDAVPDQIIYRILDNALFAPSGGNRQPWQVIIVKDAVPDCSPLPASSRNRTTMPTRADWPGRAERAHNRDRDRNLPAAGVRRTPVPGAYRPEPSAASRSASAASRIVLHVIDLWWSGGQAASG